MPISNGPFELVTAANFALAAYSLAGNEPAFIYTENPYQDASDMYDHLGADGWTFLTSAEPELSLLNSGATGEAKGFFINMNVAALVAVKDDTLTLAFRGTNDSSTIADVLFPFNDHHDWLHRDDHFLMFGGFLSQLRAYLLNHTEIKNVLVTGHSLGAAMCDALFTSSYDFRNLGIPGLQVKGLNFADPGYGVFGLDGGAAASLTTINFHEDVINFASDISVLAGDFNQVYTPESGTSWTTYHSMSGYLSFVTYLDALGITRQDIQSFAGRFFVNGVVAPSGAAFLPDGFGAILRSSGSEANFIVGGTGVDKIYGGAFDDRLYGGVGNDFISTGGGDNYVDAGIGNDIIDARQRDYARGIVLAGAGNDTIYVGSGNSGGSPCLISVDGGGDVDKLIVEARNWDTGQWYDQNEAFIAHQFGNGAFLDWRSSFSQIQSAIAAGGERKIASAVWYPNNGPYASWVSVTNVERIEYLGQDNSDLFISVGSEMRKALGGAGADALYANWSRTIVDIDWDLTSNNDASKTLANGVIVQSIDRLMLHTGQGNDKLVLGDQDDHVETGAGNDYISTGGGDNYVDAGIGNDTIDARQRDYARGIVLAGAGNDTIYVGSGNSGGSPCLISVDGGGDVDKLIVEARNWDTGQWYDQNEAFIAHQFGNGAFLDWRSSFSQIQSAIAAGGERKIASAVWYPNNGPYASWISVTNVEQIDYIGQSNSDLFISIGNEMRQALGGGSTDTLFANWSEVATPIIWNLTVNNNSIKLLGNGVVVQSIERLMLCTGQGNDKLVLGDQDDHVETGAGNDFISTGGGDNYVDAGIGNDIIDARQRDYARGTVLAGAGNDTIYVGSGNSGGSPCVISVDGGSDIDKLIVEARNWDVGQWYDQNEALIAHQFGNGALLDSNSSFGQIQSAIAGGGERKIATAVFSHFSGLYASLVSVANVERIEYLGQNNSDLFISVGVEMRKAIGGAGTDALYANWSRSTVDIDWDLTANNDASKTLANGVIVQSIERLMLRTGQGNDIIILGDQDDYLDSGSGNDVLSGGTGSNTLLGGAGNDIYIISSALDRVVETTRLNGTIDSGGIDTVQSYVSFSLDTSTSTRFIENLTLGGLSNIDATGNSLSNRLDGNAGANVIYGGEGDDLLTGGGGVDEVYGGLGLDRFRYSSISDSGFTADSSDKIIDFTTVSGDGSVFMDRIDLSAIDAIGGGGTTNDTFNFIGTATFSAVGQVRVAASGASDALIEINTYGTSGAEMTILLRGIVPGAVFDEDFVL